MVASVIGAITVMTAASKDPSRSLLSTLTPKQAAAPWVLFAETDSAKPRAWKKWEAEERVQYRAWTSDATPTAKEGGVAVVKVLTSVDAPMWLVRDLFSSIDPGTLEQWNPYAGDVQRLSGGYQQQIYKLPWPFLKREYVVRCEDTKPRGRHGGHRTHCVSTPTHPSAPEKADRVRGSSETLWVFTQSTTAEGVQRTHIHFEGIVDPKGRLPRSVVNMIAKHTCVSTVTGLAKLADERWEAASAANDNVPTAAILTALALFMGFNALAYTACYLWKSLYGQSSPWAFIYQRVRDFFRRRGGAVPDGTRDEDLKRR